MPFLWPDKRYSCLPVKLTRSQCALDLCLMAAQKAKTSPILEPFSHSWQQCPNYEESRHRLAVTGATAVNGFQTNRVQPMGRPDMGFGSQWRELVQERRGKQAGKCQSPPAHHHAGAPYPPPWSSWTRWSASHGAHQASDERVHGVVSDEAAPDSAGQPEDAQLGDLEAARLWVEAALRDGQETVHRRGQEDPRQAHDRPPGLQVPAKEEAKELEGRISVHHALSLRVHGSP